MFTIGESPILSFLLSDQNALLELGARTNEGDGCDAFENVHLQRRRKTTWYGLLEMATPPSVTDRSYVPGSGGS